MLTTSERIQVEQALTVVLAREGNPKSLVEVILGKNADPILITLAVAQPAEIARRTVDECLRNRWKLDPSLLELLLQDLVNNRGAGALNDILERVRKQIDPNPDPYEDTWLGGRRPFVDRQGFRSSVQSLIDDYIWPVLRVSAAADSFGRTYSLHYLRHLQKQLPHAVTMVSVELSPGTGPSYQVEDLLETVRSQLGIGEEIQQRTTSGYPLAAARWMLRHMMASQGQWLLVLDGFGQAGLHDEVGETIKALAVLVPSGTFRDKIKLILLDYPDPLPGHIQDEVLEEVLPLAADIVSADLKPCLAAWNAGRVRQGKRQLAAEDLARLADGILGQVPLAGKQRLVMLNKKLTELHQFP